MTLFGEREVVPLSGETRSYFYTLVIYMGVCSLNLYTQLYVCKYMYQQLKYLYCSIQHYLTLRSKSHEGHCCMWHTALWSCSHMPDKYYLKNNYLTLKSKVKVPQRLLQYATHHLMVMHPHTKYHWPISKHKNVMARTRKYYFKNNYLTLRSKVKVPQRPLWYVTHCLMVMHPHTKYHWPISKDKNVMAWTRKYYLKNNYLTSRSKFHEGHFGTGTPALWSCIHIPNIIDLSGKKKKLWSGQASMRSSRSRSRRSGSRKNQIKPICLPSFEGET
jgi:hypothetical protein